MTAMELEKYKEEVLEWIRARPGHFTMEDVRRLMRDAGFIHFKAMASQAMPGIVNILIGHDDYIKDEIQETVKHVKPITVMFHFVDCNGYGWWA